MADRVRGAERATSFECRTCSELVDGWTDGAVTERGWRSIEHIDGPNAICPDCVGKPDVLDGLRADYPDARLGSPRPVRGSEDRVSPVEPPSCPTCGLPPLVQHITTGDYVWALVRKVAGG